MNMLHLVSPVSRLSLTKQKAQVCCSPYLFLRMLGRLSIDFVEGLPQSGFANCILVIVDTFTKYAHFVPLRHPFTAASVAKGFMDHVYKLHGMPTAMVSDRDRVFTSQLWRELFALAQVQLCMSSSYHPQSDGQTERVNQCMETFLRCFVNACPKKWLSWLALAGFWYNSSFHTSIARSPFEALYGYTPRHFGLSEVDAAVPELDQWLKERKVVSDLIRQHLNRAAVRMKHQADKGRSERQFQEGELVFVKLQPYVQLSLAPRANQKLAFKFFGPFQVLKRIGSIAYKLALPPGSSIHPVFHVSQLKKAVGSVLPATLVHPELTELQVPDRILQRRMVTRGMDTVSQVLVQWSGSPLSLATWEEYEALRQRFPGAPAWGQASAYGGGDVRTGNCRRERQSSRWRVMIRISLPWVGARRTREGGGPIQE
jgi:hypothetical protein